MEVLNKSVSMLKQLRSFLTNDRTSHIHVGRKAPGAQDQSLWGIGEDSEHRATQ